MSFVRLLLANRSLNTVKDQPSPYKMKQANLLPKFGSKRKDDEAEAEPAVAVPGAIVREVSSAAAAVANCKAAPGASLIKRWLAFGNKFRHLPAGKRIPVQTELSLENVRVVRNDLQESAHATQPVGEKLRLRESVLPKTSTVAGQWWLRLQLRLFQQRRKPG